MVDLKIKSGSRGSAWRRQGPSLAITLTLAMSGCATRSVETRIPACSTALPIDLLEVASVAPEIDADLARKPSPSPSPRPAAAAGRATLPPGASSDRAIEPASAARTGDAKAASPVAPGPDESRIDAAIASAPAALTPPSIPQTMPPHPIDLATALRLADGQNPVIGRARVLILEALAQRTAARSLLLPTLNAGANYRDHVGALQRSTGAILPVTGQSLYYGGGAGAIGANPASIPAVNVVGPLTDAIFEPLAAQQRVIETRFNASATANSSLLEVASLYIDLVGNEAILATRRELAAEADRIAIEVADFAATGQGRRSDAERAEADRRLVQSAIQRAEEEVAVTSARLAERLNLDPSSQLQPQAGPLVLISLIDADVPAERLIRSAMARRPDLAARDALAMQARYQVHEERARPFLPTIWLGFSGGTMGGGSNLVSTDLGRFDGRTDFDIRAYWTLLNFGVGNASLIKSRKAQLNQTLAERSRVLNQVRDEVTRARAESLAFRTRVDVARRGVQAAEDGYRQDRDRLREAIGKPIEALDSLRLLVDARVALIRAIVGANRAQFALFVSLGAPPPLDVPLAGPPPTPPAN